MNALPIIIGALCVIAIFYRYYSAFIAAKVLALDDSRPVPSQTMFDGHNYYPTNKWVLFGHHFAAISGAGPRSEEHTSELQSQSNLVCRLLLEKKKKKKNKK